MLIFVEYENQQESLEIQDESVQNIISNLRKLFNIGKMFDLKRKNVKWGACVYDYWDNHIEMPLSLYTENKELVVCSKELSEMDKVILKCSEYEQIDCKDQIRKLFMYYDYDGDSKYDIYPLLHYYEPEKYDPDFTITNFELIFAINFCAKDKLSYLILSLLEAFCNNIDADDEHMEIMFGYISKIIDYVLDNHGKPEDLTGPASMFSIEPEFYQYEINEYHFEEITPMVISHCGLSDDWKERMVKYIKERGLDDDPPLLYHKDEDKIRLSEALEEY